MADIPAQFAEALRDRYLLERELGRGGMATVYLARDLKHDRAVALKVLRPELAATLGPERFKREIRFAARLQHPHILTVLDSGETAGQLWFTMPLVEGESLRSRLRREGQLPLPDALRVAHEVAEALQYAHDHGIIHRDIKPENLLLTTDGNTLVADFGIGRALGLPAPGERMTETGMVVGTPAYMSPEQATGDRTLDARTDVYSLGCVLYEMLAGEPPFTGPTAQAILAKRLGSSPVPLHLVREAVPAGIEAAIQRALSCTPADRFNSSADFSRALAATGPPVVVSTPSSTVATPAAGMHGADVTDHATLPRRRWARVLVWCTGGVAVLGAGLVAARATGLLPGPSLVAQGVLKNRERILIVDFKSPPGDSALGGALTEAFRIDLAQSPTITVLTPEYVQRVLQRMQRDPQAPLDAVLAREVALRDGVRAFITGDIARAGPQYVLSARLLSAEARDALAGVRETAVDSTQILPALDRLSKALRRRIGESLRSVRANEPLEQVTTASLEALRKYSQALRADERDEPERALLLLNEAIGLDTGFAMAYRKQAAILSNLGSPRSQVAVAATKAYERRGRLTERERYLTVAAYDEWVSGEIEQAIGAYRTLLETYPNDVIALNNLAEASGVLRDETKREEYARRALGVNPASAATYTNLADALLKQGKRDSARALVPEMARNGVAPSEIVEIQVRVAMNDRAFDSVEAMARRYADAKRDSRVARRLADGWLSTVAQIRGRLGEAERLRSDQISALEADGLQSQALRSVVQRASIDLAGRGRTERALAQVAAYLKEHPLSALPASDRQHLDLGYFYASAGQPEQARALLAEYQRVVPPAVQRDDPGGGHLLPGAIALAERRWQDAVTELRAADVGWCYLCPLPDLARAYEGLGQRDSAIAVYERYLSTGDLYRSLVDRDELAPSYFRLGELYEGQGNRARAADYYGRFVALWRRADPDVQSRVAEAKRRLAALAAEHAH